MKQYLAAISMLASITVTTLPCAGQQATPSSPKTNHMEHPNVVSGYSLVNGLNMYYEIRGEGHPLVLIHGGGSTLGTTFGRIIDSLARHHKVIGVELQAHGHTADRPSPLTFEQDADDVAALLKNLGISRADIFGFSNGGTTALQIAIRHPELVDKLIVASAIYKKSGVPAFIWDFIRNGSFEDMPQEFKDAFLAIRPDQEALMQMYRRDQARMSNFTDIPDSNIAAIKAHTLILAGDRDVTTPEHAVEMHRQIKNSRLMILPFGHGDYIGEVSAMRGQQADYPSVLKLIEAFLQQPE